MGGKLTKMDRYTREYALQVGEQVCQELEPLETHICGSVRRGKEMVHDVDIVVVIHSEEEQQRTFDILGVQSHTKRGKLKRSVSFVVGGLQVDLKFAAPEYLGAMLCHFTGPQHLNVYHRSQAKKLGLTLNEYGLFRPVEAGETPHYTNKAGKWVRIAGATEESVYTELKLAYKLPEER